MEAVFGAQFEDDAVADEEADDASPDADGVDTDCNDDSKPGRFRSKKNKMKILNKNVRLTSHLKVKTYPNKDLM